MRCARLRPCQKSPSAKTATFSRSNTKSGQPGRDATFAKNCNPSSCIAAQSLTSHFVPAFWLDLAAIWLALGLAARSPVKRAESFLPFDATIDRTPVFILVRHSRISDALNRIPICQGGISLRRAQISRVDARRSFVTLSAPASEGCHFAPSDPQLTNGP